MFSRRWRGGRLIWILSQSVGTSQVSKHPLQCVWSQIYCSLRLGSSPWFRQCNVQKYRKIHGLGCVTHTLAHAQFTQLGTRIFPHFCGNYVKLWLPFEVPNQIWILPISPFYFWSGRPKWKNHRTRTTATVRRALPPPGREHVDEEDKHPLEWVARWAWAAFTDWGDRPRRTPNTLCGICQNIWVTVMSAPYYLKTAPGARSARPILHYTNWPVWTVQSLIR